MSKQKGFTLIELLVVIAIIAILAAVVLVALGNARDSANDSRRQADMNSIMTATELYKNDNDGTPPTTAEGIAALVDDYLPVNPDVAGEAAGTKYTYTGVGTCYTVSYALIGGDFFGCKNGACAVAAAAPACP